MEVPHTKYSFWNIWTFFPSRWIFPRLLTVFFKSSTSFTISIFLVIFAESNFFKDISMHSRGKLLQFYLASSKTFPVSEKAGVKWFSPLYIWATQFLYFYAKINFTGSSYLALVGWGQTYCQLQQIALPGLGSWKSIAIVTRFGSEMIVQSFEVLLVGCERQAFLLHENKRAWIPPTITRKLALRGNKHWV